MSMTAIENAGVNKDRFGITDETVFVEVVI